MNLSICHNDVRILMRLQLVKHAPPFTKRSDADLSSYSPATSFQHGTGSGSAKSFVGRILLEDRESPKTRPTSTLAGVVIYPQLNASRLRPIGDWRSDRTDRCQGSSHANVALKVVHTLHDG
jgi:hypothetical protein